MKFDEICMTPFLAWERLCLKHSAFFWFSSHCSRIFIISKFPPKTKHDNPPSVSSVFETSFLYIRTHFRSTSLRSLKRLPRVTDVFVTSQFRKNMIFSRWFQRLSRLKARSLFSSFFSFSMAPFSLLLHSRIVPKLYWYSVDWPRKRVKTTSFLDSTESYWSCWKGLFQKRVIPGNDYQDCHKFLPPWN